MNLRSRVKRAAFNPKAFEKELVDLAVEMVTVKHPDIGAVVLECTEFPPYAHAIQNAIRRSVWDFVTMTNFMHAGAMRNSLSPDGCNRSTEHVTFMGMRAREGHSPRRV